MNAGQLNHRVTIQSRGATVDAVGQPVEAWNTFAVVWANVKFQRGLESLKADSTTSVARASIRIRYRGDIDTSMRVLQGSTVFNIISVLPQKPDYVDLACEVVN